MRNTFDQIKFGDLESGFNHLSNRIKSFVYKFICDFSIGFKTQDCVFHTVVDFTQWPWSGHCEAIIQYIQYCI